MMRRAACLMLLIAVLPRVASAQGLFPRRTASTLTAPVVAEAPAIDGNLRDAAWSQAQPLRDWCYSKSVNFQTVGFICRDDNYLYLAASCEEPVLEKLVTENKGEALWKNDCVEVFMVPEKKELFFAHFILSCDGQWSGMTWVPDEWGEPTRGKTIDMKYAVGREKDAWTMEAAVPISAFGYQISPGSVWAVGFNREKHTEPAENSSYQGGFNAPRQYPDLVFDGRTLVADGLGVRNLGGTSLPVTIKLAGAAGAAGEKSLRQTVQPGQRVLYPWKETFLRAEAGQGFTVDVVSGNGRTLLKEEYRFVAQAPPAAAVSPNVIPPAKFVKTVLDDPDFFPISVWIQAAGSAKGFQDMGVNVYVGGIDSYPSPKDKAYLDVMQQNGMYAIAPFKKEYVESGLINHPAFLGWMFGDEPDNADPQTGRVNRTPEALLYDFATIRNADPAHRVYLNLGAGVANERQIGRAATDEQYQGYAKTCDILSYDVYPCNSIQPDGPERLHLVAKGIDRLRMWGGPEKMVWMWIEVNAIRDGSPVPTPEEVKTQIWMALVHGADGYGFFCHSWAKEWLKANFNITGGFSISAVTPAMRAALKEINGEVKQLAPVLKSKTVEKGATVKPTLGGRVDVMVKKHDGATYVMAVNMKKQAEKPEITVAGVRNAQAEVLFENRTVEVRNGRIVDDFAPYAVHRYRIR